MAGKINTINDPTLEALLAGGVSPEEIAAALLSGTQAGGSLRNSPDYQTVQTVGPSSTTGSSTTTGSTQQESRSETTQQGRSYTDMTGLERDPLTGLPTAASLAAKAAAYNQPIEDAYRTFGDVVGVNANKVRQQRAQEMLQNRRRARWAALADSARVVSDMITAGAGGNVYRREPDQTVREAYSANQQLQRLQEAEDAAMAQQQWQNNLNLALQKLANQKDLDRTTGVQVSTGNSSTASTGRTDTSQSTRSSSTTSGHTGISGLTERPVEHHDRRTVTAPDGQTYELSENQMNSIRAGVIEAMKGKSDDEKRRILQAVGAVQNRDGSIDFPSGFTIPAGGTLREIAEPAVRAVNAQGGTQLRTAPKRGVNRAGTTAGRNRAAK